MTDVQRTTETEHNAEEPGRTGVLVVTSDRGRRETALDAQPREGYGLRSQQSHR